MIDGGSSELLLLGHGALHSSHLLALLPMVKQAVGSVRAQLLESSMYLLDFDRGKEVRLLLVVLFSWLEMESEDGPYEHSQMSSYDSLTVVLFCLLIARCSLLAQLLHQHLLWL